MATGRAGSGGGMRRPSTDGSTPGWGLGREGGVRKSLGAWFDGRSREGGELAARGGQRELGLPREPFQRHFEAQGVALASAFAGREQGEGAPATRVAGAQACVMPADSRGDVPGDAYVEGPIGAPGDVHEPRIHARKDTLGIGVVVSTVPRLAADRRDDRVAEGA